MCDMTNLYVWYHNDVTHDHIWYDTTRVYVVWLDSFMRDITRSLIFVTLHTTTCVMTWLIHTCMRYTTHHHICAWHYISPHISRHDSFARVTPHPTHSCVQTQPLRAVHASKSCPWLIPHVQSSILVCFWQLLPSRCIFESHGVATISRLPKITGLFCKRAL